MSKLVFPIALACLTLFSGCATIMTGSKQDIAFTSYPDGAKIKINGSEVCAATPCKVSVERSKQNAVVVVEKEGYDSVTREMPSDMNGWLIGNVLFGGVFGTTTDAMSGSMYKYESSAMHVELRKKQ